ESAALALRCGCDLNCGDMYRHLNDAIEQGLLDEADLDRSVKRLFAARFRLGMFDPPAQVPFASIPTEKVRCREHLDLALRMARESIVLLKNNGVLPLRKDLNHVVVVGPNAQNDVALYANYNGFSPTMVTPFDRILAKVSVGTQIHYGKGCDLWRDEPLSEAELNWCIRGDTDVVIAVLGYTTELEGEEGAVALSDGGGDRIRIGLPGRQLELLRSCRERAAGKPVVVVLLSGSPIDLSEVAPLCDAIVYAWYPGEQGGNAIADVLFGDYNPGGRLPVTFVASLAQLPPFTDYRMAGRTYRFMSAAPLYRFGYGLSYTRFTYANPKLSQAAIRPGDRVAVTVEVTNAGNVAGDEVVQLYVSDVQASVPVPRHHLEGFRRIHLVPGETTTVCFELTPEQLACYADDGTPMVEPGDFRLSLGGGQPDDPTAATCQVTLQVTTPTP
ncbi:MAG: glycoside hydrolase family 3 protein, partial [Lentisphaerae bacterium]|nr:glycoside hydrolase family 3 protein [Lentisphaerota bacterium]